METLDPNGERGRSKPRKRRTWANALVRPQTLKVLLLVLSVLIKLIRLADDAVKIIRD